MEKDDTTKAPSTNGYELPHKVGIIYSDVKREYFPTEAQYITEKDAFKYATVIVGYLDKMNIRAKLYPGNASLPHALKKDKPGLVINLVDSFKGSEYLASIIPGVIELLQIPYTGAGILGNALSNNKFLISELLQQNGIPVPSFQLFNSPSDYLNPTLRYPLISKLNEVHGSVEITQDSVSENERHLRERLKFLLTTYKQGVIVQEYIAGREVSVVLLEGLNKKVYMGERVFADDEAKYKIVSFDLKWLRDGVITLYQKYEDPILKEYVRKAFDVSGMSDYGRFDIKIDNSGRYFFLDSNCNPFLGPKEIDSTMGIILDLHGIGFEETLKRLLINTVRDSQGKERISFPAPQNSS